MVSRVENPPEGAREHDPRQQQSVRQLLTELRQTHREGVRAEAVARRGQLYAEFQQRMPEIRNLGRKNPELRETMSDLKELMQVERDEDRRSILSAAMQEGEAAMKDRGAVIEAGKKAVDLARVSVLPTAAFTLATTMMGGVGWGSFLVGTTAAGLTAAYQSKAESKLPKMATLALQGAGLAATAVYLPAALPIVGFAAAGGAISELIRRNVR